MRPHIRAKYNVKTGEVVAFVSRLTGDKIQQMGQDIVVEAKSNMRALQFKESTGEAEREIRYTKTGALTCEIATTSGHTSFIEWGQQFIKLKRPTIWPAYRTIKKALMRGRKWV